VHLEVEDEYRARTGSTVQFTLQDLDSDEEELGIAHS